MLINVTIQTFLSENELELSDKRWTDVKNEYLPKLYELGLERYTTTRIWNKSDKYQLGHIFEYRDKEAMNACLPIWSALESRWRDKITNKTISYRGVQISCDVAPD
jgi:hypothetical protein|tara:strand:- start:134 stop:451 length:318 start_codon:yes stop_codon:yes gene_type:complete